MQNKPTKLVNEKFLIEQMGFNGPTLRDHRHRGIGIPFIKHGAKVYYDLAEVEAYIDSNRVKTHRV